MGFLWLMLGHLSTISYSLTSKLFLCLVFQISESVKKANHFEVTTVHSSSVSSCI